MGKGKAAALSLGGEEEIWSRTLQRRNIDLITQKLEEKIAPKSNEQSSQRGEFIASQWRARELVEIAEVIRSKRL